MLSSVCVSLSVMLNSLWLHGLQPTRFLGPWGFLGKDTGMVCHFLLQRIFPNHGLDPGLLPCPEQNAHYMCDNSHSFQYPVNSSFWLKAWLSTFLTTHNRSWRLKSSVLSLPMINIFYYHICVKHNKSSW